MLAHVGLEHLALRHHLEPALAHRGQRRLDELARDAAAPQRLGHHGVLERDHVPGQRVRGHRRVTVDDLLEAMGGDVVADEGAGVVGHGSMSG